MELEAQALENYSGLEAASLGPVKTESGSPHIIPNDNTESTKSDYIAPEDAKLEKLYYYDIEVVGTQTMKMGEKDERSGEGRVSGKQKTSKYVPVVVKMPY